MTLVIEANGAGLAETSPPRQEPRQDFRPERGGLEQAKPALPLLDRMGLQLPVALLAAVGPLFYYTWDPYASTSVLGMLDAYAGSLLSVGLGFYVLKRVTSFPTSHAAAAVLPIFAAAFALVLGALALVGWKFDWAPVSIGFALSVIWMTGVLWFAQRGRHRQFALLPIGDTLSLTTQPGPIWKVLAATPTLPSPCDGVVVDLRADIPGHWEQFLTSCVLSACRSST